MTSSWTVEATSGPGEATGAWRAVALAWLGYSDSFCCAGHFWGCRIHQGLLGAGF